MAATMIPLARSDITLEPRRPARPASAPAAPAEITTGKVEATATRPVRATLPIADKTNHGTASVVSTLPVTEAA